MRQKKKLSFALLATAGVLSICALPAVAASDGFSRADQYSGSVPIVTTRLYLLDGKGFPSNLPGSVEQARQSVFEPKNAWEELDDIYGLMALAVVHADWQEHPKDTTSVPVRGYNIGAILINDKFEVVNFERNSNEAMCNGTQHGEVRTMLKHLNMTGSRSLKRHQIYTSLEPCMMCSGMMMQQEILRTVYMQTDNAFGKNLERLSIDSADVPINFDEETTGQKGYGPAARPVISNAGSSEFRLELDVAWRAAISKGMRLTEWLTSDEAEDIYRRARHKFENYELRFSNEKAAARFIVPKGATNAKVQEKDFLALQADKTNEQLYKAALAYVVDASHGVVPYIHEDGPKGSGPLVEDKANVLATRLLEDPESIEHDDNEDHSRLPKPELLVIDGTLGGRHVHQERVRYVCPH